MRFMSDLGFILGLYKHLDLRLKRIVACLVAAVVLPLLLIISISLGSMSAPSAPVAAEVHTPEKRSEPAPVYIPQAPTTAWPAHGAITAVFGSRTPAQRHHSGIDIGGRYGDPITPFRAGKVTVAERSSANSTGLGRYVMIDHGGGLVSVYGHLSSVTVLAGQEVNTQTVIGKEGSTGQAYGVHLHFEVRLNGNPVDPRRYVSGTPPR